MWLCLKILEGYNVIKTIAFIWGENILGYLSLDIICSSKLIVFRELRSQKTVCVLEHTMSVYKYPSIFSRQMEAFVYIFVLGHYLFLKAHRFPQASFLANCLLLITDNVWRQISGKHILIYKCSLLFMYMYNCSFATGGPIAK